MTIFSDAQQVIHKRDSKLISCDIQSIVEDGIAYIDSNNFVQFMSRNDIKSISTYVLDKDLYVENFSLKTPYTFSDLFLTNIIHFKKNSSYKGNNFRSMRVKILEGDADSILFLVFLEDMYRVDKIALESLEDLDIDSIAVQRVNRYPNTDCDAVFSTDTVHSGRIISWSKDGIQLLPESSTADYSAYFIPNTKILVMRSQSGVIVYPGDDIIPPTIRKPYPRVSLSLGFKLEGISNYSGSESGDRNTTFLKGEKRTLDRLNSFNLSTKIDITKKFDVQLRYTKMWSNEVEFRGRDNFTVWETKYKLKLNLYEVGAGYNRDNFRIGASINLSETKSSFSWVQSTYRTYYNVATKRITAHMKFTGSS
jgi:hypothetical protein